MTTERPGDRPQDVGRSHLKQGTPGPESVAILERYRAAIRLELDELLIELWPTSGQLTLVGDLDRPSLEKRRELWGLIVKLARELAAAQEAAPTSSSPRDVPGRGRASSAPRLSVAQRRALGGPGR